MNWLDIALAVMVGASIIAGFRAGFARAALGFLALPVGIVLGWWFYSFPAGWLKTVTSNTTFAYVCGFFIVFFAVQLAGSLLGKILSKFLKWTGLSVLDRIFGGGFGLVRGLVFAAAFVAVLMAFTPTPPPAWMSGSQVLPYAVDASNILTAIAPRTVRDSFDKSLAEIRKEWEEQVNRARHYRDKDKSKLQPVDQ